MQHERKQNQGKPSRDRKQARENKRFQGWSDRKSKIESKL